MSYRAETPFPTAYLRSRYAPLPVSFGTQAQRNEYHAALQTIFQGQGGVDQYYAALQTIYQYPLILDQQPPQTEKQKQITAPPPSHHHKHIPASTTSTALVKLPAKDEANDEASPEPKKEKKQVTFTPSTKSHDSSRHRPTRHIRSPTTRPLSTSTTHRDHSSSSKGSKSSKEKSAVKDVRCSICLKNSVSKVEGSVNWCEKCWSNGQKARGGA